MNNLEPKVKSLLAHINKDANATEFKVSKDTTKVEVFQKGKLMEVVTLETGDDLLEVVKQLKQDYLI